MSLAQRIMSQALNHRIRKLGKDFGRKIDHIATLNARLRGVEPADAMMNPSVIQKMARWMGNLSKLHDEETVILNEISEVEKKHQAMRKSKLLRKATPSAQMDDEPRPEPKKKANLWFWVLMYLLFFKNKPSPPAPTLKNG